MNLVRTPEKIYSNFVTSLFPIEQGIWRENRRFRKDEPVQGWKLHVSTTVLNSIKILKKCYPIVLRNDIPCKIPKSINVLQTLNSGIYGYSQIGKFMTIYCRNDKEALTIAHNLQAVTKGFHAPKVPYDMSYTSYGIIYYRYGLFQNLHKNRKRQGLRHPSGKIVTDQRAPGKAVPNWVTNPFYQPEKTESNKTLYDLGYLVYECILQRGKGGVYRAIDMNPTTPRRCIIKEGRRYGEVTYDRKDGQDRINDECRSLRELASIGIPVPKVYDSFSMNDCTCLVLEEIGGLNMQKLLRKKSLKCSMFQRLGWMTKMAEIVGLIHRSGKVWRDCKPGNFMVNDGMVTVRPIDFEGVCNIGERCLIPWATPGYIPPNYKTERKMTKQDFDLFSLGASFYHILTKKNPPTDGKLLWGRNLAIKIPMELKNIIEDLLCEKEDNRPEAKIVSRKIKRLMPLV